MQVTIVAFTLNVSILECIYMYLEHINASDSFKEEGKETITLIKSIKLNF
jgi:hypothetical protein